MRDVATLEDLQSVGFIKVGEWRLAEESLVLELTDKQEMSPALYAFVVGGEVKYVGKTVRALSKRLYGYLNPGVSQKTNVRVQGKLLESLSEEKCVDIYGFNVPEPSTVGRFLVNLPAGLEDDITRQVNPVWNGGRERQPSIKAKSASKEGESKPAQVRSAQPSGNQLKSRPTFVVTIGKTYYNQGFFNVPVDYARYFDSHGVALEISITGKSIVIDAKINRTVNATDSPRIMGGVALRDWFHSKLRQGDDLKVVVLSPNTIEIDVAG